MNILSFALIFTVEETVVPLFSSTVTDAGSCNKEGAIKEEDICLNQGDADKEEGCHMTREDDQFPTEEVTKLNNTGLGAVTPTEGNTHTDKAKEGLSKTTENKEHNVLMADAEEKD